MITESHSEFQQLISSLTEANGKPQKPWTLVSSKPNIEIYSKPHSGSSWSTWVGIGKIKHPIDKIFDLLSNTEKRSQWDKLMPVYEKVVDLPSPPTLSSTITYCATSSMISGLISAREYFDLKILDENSDNFKHMIWKSVDIESVSTFGDEVAEVVDAFEKELPSNRAVVRAWNYLGGIRVEKVVGGEECLVYYIIRSDLKGSLSSWLVNQGMVGAITSIFSSISAALEN